MVTRNGAWKLRNVKNGACKPQRDQFWPMITVQKYEFSGIMYRFLRIEVPTYIPRNNAPTTISHLNIAHTSTLSPQQICDIISHRPFHQQCYSERWKGLFRKMIPKRNDCANVIETLLTSRTKQYDSQLFKDCRSEKWNVILSVNRVVEMSWVRCGLW